jgi:hypothetical protein
MTGLSFTGEHTVSLSHLTRSFLRVLRSRTSSLTQHPFPFYSSSQGWSPISLCRRATKRGRVPEESLSLGVRVPLVLSIYVCANWWTTTEQFEDEIHPRLRFAHRGLVAMANNGAKNSNDSQFFITLGAYYLYFLYALVQVSCASLGIM